MSTTSKHEEDGHGDHPKEKKEGIIIRGRKFSWLLYLVLGLIIFFGILSVISRTKTEANEEVQNESSSKPNVIVMERTELIHVKLTGKWTLVNVPYRVRMIQFVNASTKYCVKNSTQTEYSNDTEDISGRFGEENSETNLQFWFKAQNPNAYGEDGLDVQLTYYAN